MEGGEPVDSQQETESFPDFNLPTYVTGILQILLFGGILLLGIAVALSLGKNPQPDFFYFASFVCAGGLFLPIGIVYLGSKHYMSSTYMKLVYVSRDDAPIRYWLAVCFYISLGIVCYAYALLILTGYLK